MISILIKDSNSLFSHGLQVFLKELFKRDFSQKVSFVVDYTPENIAAADVIVLSLCRGERYTCSPELRSRKKGVIIGLINEEEAVGPSPSCFEDITYINRGSSLSEMAGKIGAVWKKWLASAQFKQCFSCVSCSCRQMSSRQLQIMALYYKGLTVKQIAFKMGLNHKSVSAYKYQVMNKYNLRNDTELLAFLNVLANKNASTMSFRHLLES